MRHSLLITLAFIVLASIPSLAAETPHPTVLPLDKVDFNWPPPGEVGEKDFFIVAKDGKAACSIVIPAQATRQESKSADMLKLYLDLVTGASFEIKTGTADGPAIYIGETEVGKQTDLKLPPIKYASLTLPNLHGYLIQTVDKNTLVIRGKLDMGTSYGVVSFIREYAGVRRYWPSEPGGIGDVFEKKPTFTIPKLTWRDWPFLIGRHLGFNPKGWEIEHETDWPTMYKWYRMGFTLSMMHNFFYLISADDYGKTHPEYFPELNGRRMVPKGKINWQPCVSNPEVVDICAEKIIRAFDKNPDLICHALAVNDGAGDCACAKCRAMDSPESDMNTGQLTDRYVKFMNAVAEKVAQKHPDRLIGFLSYASVKFPPSTVKLHKNLIPFYCAMARGIYGGWDEWIAAGTQNMGHYGYHDDRWFTIPKINPHQEARRVRYMAGTNVFRGYYKEFNPTYPLDAQAAVVCADMMWDPRLDEDKIIDRYYRDMFGEVASEMRSFYEILEKDYENWLKQTAPPHPYGFDRSDLDLDHSYEQFQVLSSESADRAWDALLDAEKKAKDTKVKERIAIVKAIFSFVRPCTKEYWLTKSLPQAKSAVEAEKQAREALKLAREKAELKQKVMESPAIKPWHLTCREPYDQIKPGAIPQQVLMAIDRSFEASYNANPDDKSIWQRLAKDADPVIAQSARTVLAIPAIKDQPNLADDPGFEGSIPPEMVHVAFKQGSVKLAADKPHSGKQCAELYDCKESSLIKRIPVKPGEKYIVSAWLRAYDHSGGRGITGLYGVRVNAKKDNKMVEWTRVPFEQTADWQQIRFPYTVPAGVDTIEILVHTQRQHANARLWVDDISIVRVPVKAVKWDDVRTPTAEGAEAPEE